MKKIGVISLGCAKNLVDTEYMNGLLLAAGHTFVADPREADVLIVNTCGFIEQAKQEAIDTILEMAQYKKHGRCKTLVATGCLVERYRAALQEAMPEVDILLGVREYEKLPALLADSGSVPDCRDAFRALATPPYRAFLRISDGCSNRCTYCAIPLIRGPLHSVPQDALIREAERLAANGVTELTVIAQDTSGYGADIGGKPQTIPLLRRLAKIDSLHWLRVLYTYPDTVTPGFIDEMLSLDKVVPYLDLPLQHVNDEILSRMNRRGTNRHIRSVMEYVEKNAPHFILRTTMMVGFPGETDAQFDELLCFLREHPFDRVGAFAFSPEDGTAAVELPEQVPDAIKQARLDALMRQQKDIADARNARRIGKQTELLVERFDQTHSFGRTYAEAPDVDGVVAILRQAHHKIGQYLPITLTGASDYDMTGVETH